MKLGSKQLCERCRGGGNPSFGRPSQKKDADGLVSGCYHARCFELAVYDRREALVRDISQRFLQHRLGAEEVHVRRCLATLTNAAVLALLNVDEEKLVECIERMTRGMR